MKDFMTESMCLIIAWIATACVLATFNQSTFDRDKVYFEGFKDGAKFIIKKVGERNV